MIKISTLGIMFTLGLSLAVEARTNQTGCKNGKDGTLVLAMNIVGADAAATYNHVKKQSPKSYSKYVTPNAIFEHVRGSEIFCARDSFRNMATKKFNTKVRCDIYISGAGNIENSLSCPGSGGGEGGGGDGGGPNDGGGGSNGDGGGSSSEGGGDSGGGGGM